MHQWRDGISKRRRFGAKLFGQVNTPHEAPTFGVGTTEEAEAVGELNFPVRQRRGAKRPSPLTVRLRRPVVTGPPPLLAGSQVQTDQVLSAERLGLGIDPRSTHHEAGISLADALAPKHPRALGRPGQLNPVGGGMAIVRRAAAMQPFAGLPGRLAANVHLHRADRQT
jgi:hypothetical protein